MNLEPLRAATAVRELARLLSLADVRHVAEKAWGKSAISDALETAERLAALLEDVAYGTLAAAPPVGPPLPKDNIKEIIALGFLAVCEELSMVRENQWRQTQTQSAAYGEDQEPPTTARLRALFDGMITEKGPIDG